jgi:hypothetical protein
MKGQHEVILNGAWHDGKEWRYDYRLWCVAYPYSPESKGLMMVLGIPYKRISHGDMTVAHSWVPDAPISITGITIEQ